MAIQGKSLTEAIDEAKILLHKMILELGSFEFPIARIMKFKVNCINVDEIVKDIPIGSSEEDYIYILKVVGQNRTNAEFVNKLEGEKNKHIEDRKKDLPRINLNHKGTQYLYVGRSHKLRTRIRQHLGSNYAGTYGLHMQRWSQDLNETVEIHYFKLES